MKSCIFKTCFTSLALSLIAAIPAALADEVLDYGCRYSHGIYMPDNPGYRPNHHGWQPPYYRWHPMYTPYERSEAWYDNDNRPRPKSAGLLIDRDSDGSVTAEEAAINHEQIFADRDTDGNSQLSELEFVSARMWAGGRFGANREQHIEHRKARFKQIDADTSGAVDVTEFMMAGKERFAEVDSDGDGAVSIWEYRARQRSWQ